MSARPPTIRPWAVAAETAIVVVLGLVLSAAALGMLRLQYGSVRLELGDVLTVAAAGIAAAAVVRVNVRLHRRWKRVVGRFTAAAALCGLAAVAGSLIVMIPSSCPGGLPGQGRCGLKEAASWGQVAGLASVLNFMVAGLTVLVFRSAWYVVRDAVTQGLLWSKALQKVWRRLVGSRRQPVATKKGDAQAPKGRPTPRRAEAEEARRSRRRART